MSNTGGQYYHHKQLWYLACKARDRCIGVDLPQLADDALVAIVLAAASCEALINELAASAELSVRDPGYVLPGWFRPFASELGAMVRDHGPGEFDGYVRMSPSGPSAPACRAWA